MGSFLKLDEKYVGHLRCHVAAFTKKVLSFHAEYGLNFPIEINMK